MELIRRLALGEEGVSLVEEGFLVLLVALACITSIAATGASISGFFIGFAATFQALA